MLLPTAAAERRIRAVRPKRSLCGKLAVSHLESAFPWLRARRSSASRRALAHKLPAL
jgi:hypothetical protein